VFRITFTQRAQIAPDAVTCWIEEVYRQREGGLTRADDEISKIPYIKTGPTQIGSSNRYFCEATAAKQSWSSYSATGTGAEGFRFGFAFSYSRIIASIQQSFQSDFTTPEGMLIDFGMNRLD